MSSGRYRTIVLSYATAGLSKSVAAAVQILALPIVASSLGVEGFGALMVMGALASIFCIPARGIPPSLAVRIARARGEGDEAGALTQIRGAILVSAAFGLAAVAITWALLAYVGPAVLLGKSAGNELDPVGAGEALTVFLAVAYGLSWVEGARTGYNKHHVNNLYSLIGSVIVLVNIAVVWAFVPTVAGYFVAIYVTYPAINLIGAMLFCRRIAGRTGTLAFSSARDIGGGALEWSVAQAGVVISLQGAVWLASHAAGLSAGALVGGVVRLFQVVHSLILALLTPVLPTLSHSVASGDRAWTSTILRHATVPIAGALGMFGIVIAVFGDQILNAWLGLQTQSNAGLFAAFGLLAVAYMAPQISYLVLMAMASGRAASANLLLGAVLGTTSGIVVMQSYGLTGLVWAQALGMLAGACLPNSYLVLQNMRTASAGP